MFRYYSITHHNAPDTTTRRRWRRWVNEKVRRGEEATVFFFFIIINTFFNYYVAPNATWGRRYPSRCAQHHNTTTMARPGGREGTRKQAQRYRLSMATVSFFIFILVLLLTFFLGTIYYPPRLTTTTMTRQLERGMMTMTVTDNSLYVFFLYHL